MFQRWFVVLGMVAMLGALIVMPLTSTYALAMSGTTLATSMAMDDMPCHKPGKSCPDSPQKACPNMVACLVKCFQPLSAPVAEARLHDPVLSSRMLPAPPQVAAGSLVPPLLRPPRV